MNKLKKPIWKGYEIRRQRMVNRLETMGIERQEILSAMSYVPRHLFVEEALRSRAYDNTALPIGHRQTISQPYTVAIMTQLLLGNRTIQETNKILEIGTGCGYQTAVLQALNIPNIYSIERIRSLHDLAKHNLRQIRTHNQARLVYGDGYAGLPSVAPFDGIIVTAAPTQIPIPLLQQLKIGGRLVLPLDDGHIQHLWVIDKTEQGYLETCVQEASFVPLINDNNLPKI